MHFSIQFFLYSHKCAAGIADNSKMSQASFRACTASSSGPGTTSPSHGHIFLPRLVVV